MIDADAADWRRIVLALHQECCTDALIAEEIGADKRVVGNWRRGVRVVPAPQYREPLLRLAYQELSDDALWRARVKMAAPIAVERARWLARTAAA